jgi:hypothetical protein
MTIMPVIVSLPPAIAVPRFRQTRYSMAGGAGNGQAAAIARHAGQDDWLEDLLKRHLA